MLNDSNVNFVSNIYKYLANKEYVGGLLVKKHTGNLKNQGDFSFVNTVKAWQELLDFDQFPSENNLLKYLNKTTDDLVKVSVDWEIVISKCEEIKDRVHIHLSRPTAITVGLTNAISNNVTLLILISGRDKCNVQLCSKCTDTSVTDLRAHYLCDVVKNLCAVYSINTEITVSTRSGLKSGKDVFVGAVLNAKSGAKESKITADEFISIRQEELTLIAQHKYGVRVSTDEKWRKFIAHLGESAAAFDLLQTKSSSPVKILFDASGGSSKGAAFILYNCARLETLVRTFNEKVKDGTYPPLPDRELIDFSLLNDEDEWCLIFTYIMGLPSVLNSSAEVLADRVVFRPHLICNYLSGMVKVFSQYYRRVRILTESRKHLVPVLHARVYMITILNDTLKTCLQVLNIKSVSQM